MTSAFRRWSPAAANVERSGRNVLVDFGRETFGFVRLKALRGSGRLNLYYGESAEEARRSAKSRRRPTATRRRP